VFPDARTGARVVAARIAAALQANPGLVLGLATGRTPIALYGELARLSAERTIDWSSVTTFNLDEFVGLPQDDLLLVCYLLREWPRLRAQWRRPTARH
jgi:glucosamine-6-phosphate deaminase